jgi:hexosaminidase
MEDIEMRVRRPLVSCVVVTVVLGVVAAAAAQPPAPLNLMPVPASLTVGQGGLVIEPRFGVRFDGYKDARLERAAERMLVRVTRLTAIPIVRSGTVVALTIKCGGAPAGPQRAVEDESYTLSVEPGGATLTAPAVYGVLRGLETLTQLIEPLETGFAIRSVTITDHPRFPWRGLLIDVCRHWMPIEVVKRNLDAMAAVKLNVLHWHLSEDQGFRVESRVYPLLHQKGSDGLYYSQEQVREVVRYAADRGIRVVPEFDMPAHTQAWLAGYPDLSAGKGPFEIARTWGVFDPVLDPTSERVYAFLDRLLAEMAALFPDACFHIGGDEVNGKQWDASAAVTAFKKRHGMAGNDDLQAYFNKRVASILRARGKTMVGWDEVLHKDLPRTAVVQSWRGQKALADAAAGGYRGVLSNGYYLDYIWPADRHYAVDPLGKDTANLSAEAKARILGGEACMWAEWVTPETIDSRIWPRMAAIAERYWSQASVTDAADMYRRLSVVSQRLDATGITHRAGYQPMLERLAGYRDPGALRAIVDLVEPVRDYNRGRRQKFTSLTPLNRLVDAARPESEEARAFAQLVESLLNDPARVAGRETIAARLTKWQQDARDVRPVFGAPLLQDAVQIVQNLNAVTVIGLKALEALQKRTPLVLTPDEREALAKAGTPVADVLLMVAQPVQRLADAAK